MFPLPEWLNADLAAGIRHIADPGGIDHMVFLLALCAVIELRDWKKALILVTAFTVGHSLTLIAAGLNVVVLPSSWIEFMIPLTIFSTALSNIRRSWYKGSDKENRFNRYVMALLFGLIHGFGFSNFFRMMSIEGENIVYPLLMFNVGVEIGQIAIVSCILFLSFFLTGLFRIRQPVWTLFISIMSAGISLLLTIHLLFKQ
jgi:hypothetical protein